MRILCLSPDLGIAFDGTKGASAHLRSIVHGFRDAGHAVLFLSPTVEHESALLRGVALPGLFDGLDGGVPKRVGRALRHIWANAGIERALETAVSQFRPDLIYERYGPFSVAGGIVARRRGVAHLLEVNSSLAREGAAYRNQALNDAAAALEMSALATAGAVIAVSAELARELVGDGVAPERLHVVPNGFDPALFHPRARASGGPVTFAFVGGLRPWHGIADMAEAFRRIAPETDARLLVIGQGPEEKHVLMLAEELPGRVELTGAVPQADVAERLGEADVALAPYPDLERFHYSPLMVLEYMGAGLPVVASEIGQVAELLEHESTALFVPPGDVGALADAMRRLAGDACLRGRLGVRAAEIAHAEHGWPRRIDQILAIAEAVTMPA